MKKYISFMLLFLFVLCANAQQISKYRYFIDNQPAKEVSVNSATFDNTILFDIGTGLTEGLHTFNIQFADSNGKWSPLQSQNFIKQPLQKSKNEIKLVSYWFDNQQYEKQLTVDVKDTLNVTQNVVVPKALPEGLHTFNIQFKDALGNWSPLQSQNFIKLPLQKSKNEIKLVSYWFDNQQYKKQLTVDVKDTLNVTKNVVVPKALPEGLHTFNIQFKDALGNWSPLQSQNFIKLPLNLADNKLSILRYWFDEEKKVELPLKDGVLAENYLIKVADKLATGIHTFNVQVKDAVGHWTPLQSQNFIKVKQVKDNKIIAYKYWYDKYENDVVLNENLKAEKDTLDITENLVVPASVPAGKHLVNFQFKDKAGLWSSVYEKEVEVSYTLPAKVQIANVDDELNSIALKVYPGALIHRYYKLTDTETKKPVRGAKIKYEVNGKTLFSKASDADGFVDLFVNLAGEKLDDKSDDVVPDVRKSYKVSLKEVVSNNETATAKVDYATNTNDNFDFLMKDFSQVKKSQGVMFGAGFAYGADVTYDTSFFGSNSMSWGVHVGVNGTAKLNVKFNRNDATDKVEELIIGIQLSGNFHLTPTQVLAKLGTGLGTDNMKISGKTTITYNHDCSFGVNVSITMRRMSKAEMELRYLQLLMNVHNIIYDDNIKTYELAKRIESFWDKKEKIKKVLVLNNFGSFYGGTSSQTVNGQLKADFDLTDKGINYKDPKIKPKQKLGLSIGRKLSHKEGWKYDYNYKLKNTKVDVAEIAFTTFIKDKKSNYADLSIMNKKSGRNPFNIKFPLREDISFQRERKVRVTNSIYANDGYSQTGTLSHSMVSNVENVNWFGRKYNKSVTQKIYLGKNALSSFDNFNGTMSFFDAKMSLELDKVTEDIIAIKDAVIEDKINTDSWTLNDFEYAINDTYTKAYSQNWSWNLFDKGGQMTGTKFSAKVTAEQNFSIGISWNAKYPRVKLSYVPALKQMVPHYENIGVYHLQAYIENPAESEISEFIDDAFEYIEEKFDEFCDAFADKLKTGTELVEKGFKVFKNKIFKRKTTGISMTGDRLYVQETASNEDKDKSSIFEFSFKDDNTTVTEGTEVSLRHLFTNGELKGKVRTNGEEKYQKFLIISDLMFFKAEQNDKILTETLKEFDINVEVGQNDLTYFGVDKESVVELFYSLDSKTEWESLGAITDISKKQNFKSKKLGVYALGVRLKADTEKPVIKVTKTEGKPTISYEISDDNSGVDWSSVYVEVNGNKVSFAKKENDMVVVTDIPEGNSIINLWVKDNYGNLAYSSESLYVEPDDDDDGVPNDRDECPDTPKGEKVDEKGCSDSQKIKSVIVTPSTLLLKVNETAVLTATVLPASATNKAINWTSSDSGVATVDNTGNVTAKSNGVATITVTTVDGGKTATCEITVTIPVESVTVDPVTLALKVKEKAVITATITPANATNKDINWKSSNSSIAEVDAKGKVTAKSIGYTTIIVTTVDGGKTATCEVNVTEVTAIDETTLPETKVWGSKGAIYIHNAPIGEQLSIYNISGILVLSKQIQSTDSKVNIRTGTYIIVIKNKRYKAVVIR